MGVQDRGRALESAWRAHSFRFQPYQLQSCEAARCLTCVFHRALQFCNVVLTGMQLEKGQQLTLAFLKLGLRSRPMQKFSPQTSRRRTQGITFVALLFERYQSPLDQSSQPTPSVLDSTYKILSRSWLLLQH